MGLSFLRGLVAAVNPCGFILLPTYLMYFLGMQGQHPGSQRASIRRALVVSAAVSAGFLAVFLVAGLVSVHFTQWINRNARYATVVIGVAPGRARRGHAVRLQAPDLHAAVGCRRTATHRRLDVRLRHRLRGGVDRLHDRAVPRHPVGQHPLRRGDERGRQRRRLRRRDGVGRHRPHRSRSPSPTPVCCACSAPACVTSRRSPPCSSSCPVCTSCTTSGSST